MRNDDKVLKSYDLDGERHPARLEARVDSSDTILAINLESVVTCERQRFQQVMRRRETERHTKQPWLHAAFFVIGLGAGGLGGYVIGENLTLDDPDDRRLPIGADLEQGRNIGIGIAAAGGLALLSALATSLRTVDTTEVVGNVEISVEDSSHAVECERHPAAGEQIGLVLQTDGTARVYVPIGTTDSAGRATVTWQTVVAQLPANVRPEASVVAGARAAVDQRLIKREDVPSLATVIVPLTVDPEAAWLAATRLDTVDAYVAFRSRYPTSPRAGDAIARERAARARDLLSELEAALGEEDLERADRALSALGTSVEPTVVAAATERVDALRRVVRVRRFQTRLGDLLASIEKSDDPSIALATATAAIDEVRAYAPEIASAAELTLSSARDRAVTRLVKAGVDAATARAHGESEANFTAASNVAVDVPAVTKAKRDAYARTVKTGHAEAKQLAKAAKYDEAIAIVTALVPFATNARALEADKRRWEAAAERAAATEAARIAREDRARERQEQTKRDEEARKERTEQARLQREQEREIEKARQAEKAQRDADAAEAARRAKAEQAEAAKRAKAEAERLREEARQKEAAERLAREVEKQKQPTSVTVQFELPSRFTSDDVVKRIPTPASCTAQSSSFYAKPTTCKDCAPREMTRMDLTCGAVAMSFLRDQNMVWLTCGERSTCSACLDAGTNTLGAFLTGKEKLKVAQGCPRS